MNDKVYLLSLTVSGIKNIRNNVRLEFYKKTVNKSFDPSKHRVKAIYGENGCGKTAVITAAQILKDMICNRTCLDDPGYQDFLRGVINLLDKKLHLECEFYYYTEPANQIYHYTVDLIQNDSGTYIVGFEELTFRKADYPASKITIAYGSDKELDAAGCDQSDDEAAASANDAADKHIVALKELGSCLCTNIVTDIDGVGVSAENMIEASDEGLERLTRFVKIIKPELVSINAADSNSRSKSRMVLNYGEYSVSLDQEGSGIRQLIGLWPYMEAIESGRIVFIDGFDRDVNEVVLDRLIQYFTAYGNGQLCITINNTSPMKELRKYKNAIDFLSSDGKLTRWRTSGNFSPDSLYKGGMIESLPFNIEPEDFLGVL